MDASTVCVSLLLLLQLLLLMLSMLILLQLLQLRWPPLALVIFLNLLLLLIWLLESLLRRPSLGPVLMSMGTGKELTGISRTTP